jgi:hypothetical protein
VAFQHKEAQKMTQAVSHRSRLAGIALVVGGTLAIAGYVLTDSVVGSSGDSRFTNSLFAPLYSIALAGVVLSIIGLPAILAAHAQRATRLSLVGYVGLLTTLVMLNLGEGVIEEFVKPYLATHGGIPKDTPAALNIYFGIAFLFLVAGLIALGVAVIRAKELAWWVGALFIASVPVSFVGGGLPGPLAELGDYLAFLGLIAIGWHVARPASRPHRLASNAEATA